VETAVKRVVNRIVNLPTLPQMVSTIVSLTGDSNCSIRDVTNAISMDPTISAKILKLVNSAFYGFPSQISNLSQAVVLLGLNTVRNVTLSASVFGTFQKNGNGDGKFDRTACLVHSSSVAFIARYLANKTSRQDSEEAFVGGLLHDIGKLILDTHLSREFIQAVELADAKGMVSTYDAEQEMLGVTHATIGRWLIERWKLPDSLGEAVGYHHAPDEAPGNPRFAALLCMANCMDHALSSSEDGIDPSRISPMALDLLGLEAAHVPGLLDAAREESEKANAFFSALDDAREASG